MSNPVVVSVAEDANPWWDFYQKHKVKIWGAVWALVGLLFGSNISDETINTIFPYYGKLNDRVIQVERDVEQLKAAVFEPNSQESE